MASSTLVENGVSIRYSIGVNSAGKEVFETQNFNKVSVKATDAQIIELADKVEDLLDEFYTVSTVKKICTYMVSRV